MQKKDGQSKKPHPEMSFAGEFAFLIDGLELLQKVRTSCPVFTVQTMVSRFVDKME